METHRSLDVVDVEDGSSGEPVEAMVMEGAMHKCQEQRRWL